MIKKPQMAESLSSSAVPRPSGPDAMPGARVQVPQSLPRRSSSHYGDKIYSSLIFLASLSIFVIIFWIVGQLVSASLPTIHKFGLSYITGSDWDEDTNRYHVLPFIFGTLYSSFIALVLAVPVSLGAAIFLSEMAPRWIRTPATFLIELLAAIPSVVYGLWGLFVMIPWLTNHVFNPAANDNWARFPVIGFLFKGLAYGNCMGAAGVILAIMVIPFITAVTRDILRSIPRAQREGSYALGATQWETISRVVTPYARSGIIGGVMLGLGRALGETMAVTMVIGNQAPNTPNGISFSLLDPGYTLSSVLANKFNEASGTLNLSALVEIGLVLFLVTIVVNILARMLVFYTAKDVQGRR